MLTLDPVTVDEAREEILSKALKSFRFFVTEVMGFNEDGPINFCHPAYDPFFEATTKWLTMDGMGQASRGTGKSTLWTQLYGLWLGLKNPNRRICVSSAKYENACDMVNVIRRWMMFHSGLREIFGPYGFLPPEGKKDWGRMDRLDFPLRTANFMEGTIEARGADQQITSRHYDLMIGDDLVNEQTSNTKEQIEATKKWWSSVRGLMVRNPAGQEPRRILIGTRWDDSDLYGAELERIEEAKQKGVKVSYWFTCLPALYDIHGKIEDANCRFPHLNAEVLNGILYGPGGMTATLFSGQYLLDPIPDGIAMIKEAYLRDNFYNITDIMEEQKNGEWKFKPGFEVAITCDLAIGQLGHNDRTAILVSATDPRGHIYIIDEWAGKVEPSVGRDILAAFVKKYEPDWMGTEPGQLRLMYESVFREWNKDHPKGPMLLFRDIETGGGKGSKNDRCLSIQPYARDGKIHILKSQTELFLELCRYPKYKYDDRVDALAFRCLNPRRPRSLREKKRISDDAKPMTTQITERVRAAAQASQNSEGWY